MTLNEIKWPNDLNSVKEPETTTPPGKPVVTPPTTSCDRRNIILYLLWIEDDFGLRNHKNSHKMGEFFGYFLNQENLKISEKNF